MRSSALVRKYERDEKYTNNVSNVALYYSDHNNIFIIITMISIGYLAVIITLYNAMPINKIVKFSKMQ